MHVHIHQPRADHQSPGVDNLGLRLPKVAADDRDLSVLNQNVHNAADAPNRVNQSSLAYE